MPWKVTNKMNEKTQFAIEAQTSDNFTSLCKKYGISRKTGYKWKERFLRDGINGLSEQSRRPKKHKNQLTEETVCKLIRIKNAHTHWGPKKIKELYCKANPNAPHPSLSSVKRIFEKSGLVKKRKTRRHTLGGSIRKGIKATRANHIWTVDFKGWWLTSEKLRCEPLTIRDEYSRKILAIEILPDTKTEGVKRCFERLFQEFGLPDFIRSDNGSPFASANSLLGLTRLSAWWLELGINLERSRPGKPQDNGAHERMHKDIRDEIQQSRPDLSQEGFNLWLEEYNTIRPHEALNMKTPNEYYEKSTRSYQPEVILDYGVLPTRIVDKTTGLIKMQGVTYKVTSALGGKEVGLRSLQNGLTEVWFAKQLLCFLDPSNFSTIPATVELVEDCSLQSSFK